MDPEMPGIQPWPPRPPISSSLNNASGSAKRMRTNASTVFVCGASELVGTPLRMMCVILWTIYVILALVYYFSSNQALRRPFWWWSDEWPESDATLTLHYFALFYTLSKNTTVVFGAVSVLLLVPISVVLPHVREYAWSVFLFVWTFLLINILPVFATVSWVVWRIAHDSADANDVSEYTTLAFWGATYTIDAFVLFILLFYFNWIYWMRARLERLLQPCGVALRS